MSVRQIAALSGFSKSAVSMALADHPRISPATRARVLQIARRLGYRPNAKYREAMSQLRLSREARMEACFGVVSLYPTLKPWEESVHLRRIYAGMVVRAEALGYRLEPIGIRTSGMTASRARSILDARGIEGLLCFGSPEFTEEFPSEFRDYAIVTMGLSIRTHLHRVITHSYDDVWAALDKLHELGYRRPGLVLGRYEEVRSGQTYLSAYFGWCEHFLGTPALIPVLRQQRVESEPLAAWLRQHRPDAVLVVHRYDMLADFSAALRTLGVRVPGELGVAVVSQILEGTALSGMQENQQLMGAWAVELLVARIMNRDFGIPAHPRIELVQSEWIHGRSLQQATASRRNVAR